jgi:hypothetical protein
MAFSAAPVFEEIGSIPEASRIEELFKLELPGDLAG